MERVKRDKPELEDLVWMWLDHHIPKHLIVWPKSDGINKSKLFFIQCRHEHELVMLSVDDDIVRPGMYIKNDFNWWQPVSKFNEFSEEYFATVLSTINTEDANGCRECRKLETDKSVST